MTKEDLLHAGYKKITSGIPWMDKNADDTFQKQVVSGLQTKYYIDVYYYECESTAPEFEFELYSSKDGYNMITSFYSLHDRTLQEVEKIIDDYFNLNNLQSAEDEEIC